MIRRPPRSTPLYSSAASDVYKRQRDSACVQGFHDLGKIGQAAGETIDLIDDDGVDLVGFNIFEQSLERWSVQSSPGISSVVVAGREFSPAFVSLARNKGLAGFPLSIERIEGLLESFL